MKKNFLEYPKSLKKIGAALMVFALIAGPALPTFADENPSVVQIQPKPEVTAKTNAVLSNGKTINLSSASLQLPWAMQQLAESLPLIAHALGEIDGYTLTNSKTALKKAYDRGYRMFEMDYEFTSDGVLVGVHDWGNYAKSTGWTKENFDFFVIPDHKTFMNTKLYGYMEPLDLKGILEFMVEHPDVWLITDTKATDKSTVQRQFEQIVETAMYTEGTVLERIIPQVYTKEMHGVIQEAYPFSSYIYTLYAAAATDDEVVRTIKETGIRTVTMPSDRAQKNLLDRLTRASAYVCVHTVNEVAEAEKLKTLGVKGIYTDNLMPY